MVRIPSILLTLSLWPTVASACMCMELPTFDTMMTIRHRVLVGRVISLGSPYAQKDTFPPYLDLEVVEVVKGGRLEPGVRVRVWDGYFATSCAGSLSGTVEGSFVAVAVAERNDPSAKNDPSGPAVTSGRPGRELRADETDYFLGVCGTHWEALPNLTAITSVRQRLAAANKRHR